MNDDALDRLTDVLTNGRMSDEQRQKLSDARLEWPGGKWSRPQRQAFCALLEIVGVPTKARKLMDTLELWKDERRPPDEMWQRWAEEWRMGALNVPQKVRNRIETEYNALRRADLDETIATGNTTLRTIMGQVQEGTFNEKYSGPLQHIQNLVVQGTEKRHQAFTPKKADNEPVRITPTFVLMPPSDRPQLPQVIEGEVVGRSG